MLMDWWHICTQQARGCCASVLFSMPKPSHTLLWVRREYSQCKWVYSIYKLSPGGLASRTILCPSSSSHTQPSYHGSALYREGGVWSLSPHPPDITRDRGNYSQQLCWSSLSSLGRPLNSSHQAKDHMVGTRLSHRTAIVNSGLFSALMISCSDLFKLISGLLKSWVCKPSPSLLGLIFFFLLQDNPSWHDSISLSSNNVVQSMSPPYFSFMGHLVLFVVH